MKKYSTPKIEITVIKNTDIITASGVIKSDDTQTALGKLVITF